MKRDKSIVARDMERCFVCGDTQHLHIHEVFFGTANRKKSIEWGLYVPLCPEHHNMSNKGVHFNKTLDTKLKKYAQKKFEEKHGHEKFMEVIGKNYL